MEQEGLFPDNSPASGHPYWISPKPDLRLLKENAKALDFLICWEVPMSFSWTWVWLPVTYIRAEPTSRVSCGQDPHFRLFRWRFQRVVLGQHFVHGCQKQAFWEERVLVAISLTGPSIHIVSLGCSARQDPSQCWLTPGPVQSIRLTSRRPCQRYDGQAFWEESYFRLQLAIHQASGICPMLPISKGYVMSSLEFHFPSHSSLHSSSTFLSPIFFQEVSLHSNLIS